MATIDELINLISNSTDLTIEDRVTVVRLLASTIPDLTVPERRLKGRIDSAQGVRPEFVESAILGLELSPLWQQSSSTNPKFLRSRLDEAAAFRLLRSSSSPTSRSWRPPGRCAAVRSPPPPPHPPRRRSNPPIQ